MLKFFMKQKNKKGFTLIELIIVIAILGILAAIAVPRFSGMKGKAEKSADAANIKLIENALSIYEAEKGEYPDDNADRKACVNDYLSGDVPKDHSGNDFYYNKNDGSVKVGTGSGFIPFTVTP